MNSLNGGAAPAVNAPKGPPVAVIVIVILVIIGIIVGVVMATRPAPKAAALPATVPPPPAAVTPTPPPPAAVPVGSSPASSIGGKIAEVKSAQDGVKMGILPTQTGGKIAELKGPQQAQDGVKMGGKIAEVKPPPPQPNGTFSCNPGWELVDRKCFEKCKEGENSLGAPVYECGKCPPGSGNYASVGFRCTGPKGGMKDPNYYKRRSMPAMFKPK